MAEGLTEGEVLDSLRELATGSSEYAKRLQVCRPYVERLAEDFGPGAALAVSLMVALAPQLGTPVHVERTVRAILEELESSEA